MASDFREIIGDYDDRNDRIIDEKNPTLMTSEERGKFKTSSIQIERLS